MVCARSVPTFLLDCSVYNTPGRYQGIGSYAFYLARSLAALRGELRDGERLVAAVGLDTISEDLLLERHAQPLPPRQRWDRAYSHYFRRRWLDLAPTLARSGADVIHFVEGPQVLPTWRARTAVTCHDLIPLLLPREYLPRRHRYLLQLAKDHVRYKSADGVIAISRATRASLVERLGLSAARITTVLQGVDHQRYHPRAAPGEREAHGLPPRYALYVGMADPRKRVDLLLRAYARVYRATGVPLVLVGRWCSDPPRSLRPLLAALPGEALRLVGAVDADALPAYYRQAELHVLPSVLEGFGLTVLEAMASGCPVITTGAIAEVAGDAAALVAPDSAPELEAALVRLLDDEAERARLRARGLAHAASFTWERAARETLAVYRALAG
jgi:glycosyltransferase involved in cell wall biosynthesis